MNSPNPARITSLLMGIVVATLLLGGCPQTTGVEPESEPAAEPEPEVPACAGHDGGDGSCVDVGTCVDGFTLLRSGRCAGWVHIGELSTARSAALVTHLGGPRFAVTGGFATNALEDDVPLNDITVVDVESGEITDYPLGGDDRTYHSGARLDDGRLLLVGGTSAPYSVDTFDPEQGTLEGAGSNGIARSQHRVARLADGRVLHFGGSSDGDTDSLFDGNDDSWTQVNGIGGTAGLAASGQLPDGRPFHLGGWSLDKTEYIPDDRLFVFDVERLAWDEKATLPLGLLNVSAAATESGTIVAACGSALIGEEVLLPREIFVNIAPDENASFSATRQLDYGRGSCGLHSIGGEEVVIIGQSQSDDEGFPAVTAPITQVYDAETQTLTAVPGPEADDTRPRTGADRGFAFAPGIGGLFAGGAVGTLGINGYVFERSSSIDLFVVGD